jgi:tetratricopeptide (TPR) repeat protein
MAEIGVTVRLIIGPEQLPSAELQAAGFDPAGPEPASKLPAAERDGTGSAGCPSAECYPEPSAAKPAFEWDAASSTEYPASQCEPKPAAAKPSAEDLERRFGQDTSVRFSYLPALRALLAMNHGEPAKAIELLQAVVPYDLSTPRSSGNGNFGALYPVYVRGEAYLAAHHGPEAAAEFQKILDHRGIVVSDPIAALAHLQLGRALALSGDKIKAKAAYQDFLTLWKDADPDIPILTAARKDYAALD